MGIAVRRYLHNIAPRSSYERTTKSLASWATIKDFKMWREKATVPTLANTMTQRSISYVHARGQLEQPGVHVGRKRAEKFLQVWTLSSSLHPKTTNWCDGKKTVETLRSHSSLVVSLGGDTQMFNECEFNIGFN